MDIGDVTKNAKLMINGAPHNVENVNFVKPGKGRAIYHVKVRNLVNGNVTELTYHSGDKVDETNITSHDMQYLYRENDGYVFMDSESFEQYPFNEEQVGDKKYFLKEGMPVTVLLWDNIPIDLSIPKAVELKVIESEAGSKSETITAQSKTAILETGYSVGVPSFVKVGDIIRIDTRNGAYVERVTRE